MTYSRKYLLIAVVIILVVVSIIIIATIVKKAKKANRYGSTPPAHGPYISAEYIGDKGIFDDGQCGWLDIECEDGSTETANLSFNKKAPRPIIIPLKVATYRITYRSQSKAAMLAADTLKSVNASSGAMGAFANAVFDAGVGAKFSTAIINVDENFVLKLGCSNSALEKNCQVIS